MDAPLPAPVRVEAWLDLPPSRWLWLRDSRGMVLVNWWLPALPQYVVVGFFLGGFREGGGLIGLLALYAGMALATTARYPAGRAERGER